MTHPLNVLLVEDSAADAKLIAHELRRRHDAVHVERVEDVSTMRAALETGTWDVVISDWSMPKFGAIAALELVQKMRLDIPFIIASGTIGEETAVAAMRAGAHDYVLKSKLARLPAAIERELKRHEERKAHRREQEEHRKTERKYRRIIETTPEGICIVDVEGRFSFVSARLEQMLGYEPGELQGVPMLAVVDEADHACAQEGMRRRRRGLAESGELKLRRKDGQTIWVLRSSSPIIDDEGLYQGAFSMLMEITDRKRAEESLRESQEQLRQAQKMEAVGRLAGGVAHDFNNLLSVILSYGELLLESLDPSDPIRADIDEIHKAAMRAATLTRQLLVLSRQHVVAPKVVDLHDVLAGMQSMLQRILGEDVELVLVPPKARGRVNVDPCHVEQVILNLVVNARDAMPMGGKLTLETENVVLDESYALNHVPAKAGRHVMMAVSDTGTGMDRETQRRIFEPFFTTKEVGKGTGLGLSTVFGVVQQGGGNISVYSEVGKGTTFKVHLPRVDADVDELCESAVPALLRGTETILLVEDDELLRAVVLDLLRRQGYRVIPARHAAEALLLCDQHPEAIDLLLTDVVMPQMSGPELAKRLLATRPELKVLCMSGYTGDSVVRHGLLEAGVAFLQKPITPAALASKLRQVLDGELHHG